MMPAHVRAALVEQGTLTPSGLGRRAQLRPCPRCRWWTVVGLDHFRCAREVALDPVELDEVGEAIALVTGRATYELWGREIEQRDQHKIRGGQSRPVLAAHDCAHPVTPSLSIIRLFRPQSPTSTDKAEPCPY